MMSYISLDDIIVATGGTCLSKNKTLFQGVGTDTRVDLNGKLFIPLKGENFDAHDFVDQAVQRKAEGLIVSRITPFIENLFEQITVIQVNDTLEALQKLAQHRRAQSKAKIIAITGSNGKTTTKEFTAAILRNHFKIHYNQGSYNNHWGVPLTLLDLKPSHEIMIVEMGMNNPGEISQLVQIAKPDIIGVTMVGRAHLQGLGHIEAVAQAKEEIYQSVQNPFAGVFNLDNKFTNPMLDRFKENHPKALTFTFSSVDSSADVYFKLQKFTIDQLEIEGKISACTNRVSIPVFGRHNLTNLMAASAFALAAGLDPKLIWLGLPRCKSTWGRNEIHTLKTGTRVIFDAYNANPDSQGALIENIKHLDMSDGRIIGIFGDMRELGEQSCPLHEELGQVVASAPFDYVWFIGPHADFFEKGFVKKQDQQCGLFTSRTIDENVLLKIKHMLKPNDLVVIKASRGMRLEKVLDLLKN
jgi:UDP-N-acetylmuramoyl-tripeptide--D-alanyl-D-alanine ligase